MTTKTNFFEGYSWLKFSNLRLALATALQVYTSMAQCLKLKVRKFWGLILTFAEVTEEKTGRDGRFFDSPILNKVYNCQGILNITFPKTHITFQLMIIVFSSSTMIIYARTGPKGDPVTTPPLCWYILLLKVNDTFFCAESNQIFHFFTSNIRCFIVVVVDPF